VFPIVKLTLGLKGKQQQSAALTGLEKCLDSSTSAILQAET